MNLQFTKAIDEIEAELAMSYLPGTIQWADETQAFAWTNAIERLAAAIDRAQLTGDFFTLKNELQIYKAKILALIADYKKHLGANQLDMFLSSLDESG